MDPCNTFEPTVICCNGCWPPTYTSTMPVNRRIELIRDYKWRLQKVCMQTFIILIPNGSDRREYGSLLFFSSLWDSSMVFPAQKSGENQIFFAGNVVNSHNIHIHGKPTLSIRFVIKPEGVSNVFLINFWLNQWGGSMKTWGVERHQREG